MQATTKTINSNNRNSNKNNKNNDCHMTTQLFSLIPALLDIKIIYYNVFSYILEHDLVLTHPKVSVAGAPNSRISAADLADNHSPPDRLMVQTTSTDDH